MNEPSSLEAMSIADSKEDLELVSEQLQELAINIGIAFEALVELLRNLISSSFESLQSLQSPEAIETIEKIKRKKFPNSRNKLLRHTQKFTKGKVFIPP
jgi:hypothetical protein